MMDGDCGFVWLWLRRESECCVQVIIRWECEPLAELKSHKRMSARHKGAALLTRAHQTAFLRSVRKLTVISSPGPAVPETLAKIYYSQFWIIMFPLDNSSDYKCTRDGDILRLLQHPDGQCERGGPIVRPHHRNHHLQRGAEVFLLMCLPAGVPHQQHPGGCVSAQGFKHTLTPDHHVVVRWRYYNIFTHIRPPF